MELARVINAYISWNLSHSLTLNIKSKVDLKSIKTAYNADPALALYFSAICYRIKRWSAREMISPKTVPCRLFCSQSVQQFCVELIGIQFAEDTYSNKQIGQ